MKPIKQLAFLAACVMSLSTLTPVFAQSIQPVTIESKMGFDETISAIRQAVSKGGMMVLSELNQGKILSMTGLHIHAASLFIGNPNAGKMAFQDNPAVGVVIPVRVNIYEDHGHTYINYFKPSDLLAAFQGEKVHMLGNMLDKKLESMMGMLSR
ncbi:MAG: hypothetical protein AA908_10195 [Chlorobi bacterium NICIL-2]|nr:MAG: hypothetical protein AA908_10195 [Chlorobi bacterium NICIL-2]